MLDELGLAVRVVPAALTEAVRTGERPERYVERMAREKLAAVAELAVGLDGAALLVADTAVVLEDDVLGKPSDVDDAVSILERLAGREHRVLTAYAIARGTGGTADVQRTVETRVVMRAATSDELVRYARTGEGADKAGAYAIQGIGAFLVERIEGSHSNVIGLPLCEVVRDLRRLGLLGHFP